MAKIIGIDEIVLRHDQRAYFLIDAQLRDEPIQVQKMIVDQYHSSRWPGESTMIDFQKGHDELIEAWTAYRVWENENLLKK